MSLQRITLFIAFIMVSVIAFAQQTVVKGKLLDADTNEGLPFATAIWTGTTVGVTTDIDGNYELITTDLSLKSVTFSYVGYQPEEVKINPGKVNEKNVKVKPVKLELDVVEVKAKRRIPKDTAAIALYRKVVANKYRNDPTNYDYISYKQYDKSQFGFYDVTDKFKESKIIKKWPFMLENMDTTENGIEVLPVLLKETSRQIYYRKDPRKEKEIVMGDRFSGVENNSIADLFDYNFQNIEVYGNLIAVNGKPFMSPFADGARLSYKYFLTDTAVIDDLNCYKLEFTGRGNADAAFSGYAWIHDSTYALKSIRLVVLPNANINFVSDFIVEQDFILLDGENWIKNNEFLQTEYNIIKKKDKGKDKQSILIRKTSQRTDLTVNKIIDDKYFDGESKFIQEGARKRDEAFWDTARVDSLARHEKGIFKTVDSIQNSGFYKAIRWFTYMGTTGWMSAKYVDFGKIYQMGSWNDVEGARIRFGMRTRGELTKRLQISPYFAYGTKDKLWKYGAEARIHLKQKNEKWHMLGLSHNYDMTQITDYNPILRPTPLPYDIFALSLLRSDPLEDLFLVRHSRLFYEKEWVKGFNTRLAFDHKINNSVPTGIQFTVNDALVDSVKIPIEKFTTSEASFGLVWGKDLKFYNSGGGFRRFPIVVKSPILIFDYKIGIKGLFKSDYNYHKFHIGLQQRLLGPIGFTVYKIHAGIILGDAPYPVLSIHEGNETYLYNKFAFNAMNESEFVSDKYASVSIVHHFDGLIFNKIPGINKLQIRSLITYRVLYGHLKDSNKNVLNLPKNTNALNDWYMEAGFGLENILKLIRVDMLFRITQRDLPTTNKWAIRFSILPNF